MKTSYHRNKASHSPWVVYGGVCVLVLIYSGIHYGTRGASTAYIRSVLQPIEMFIHGLSSDSLETFTTHMSSNDTLVAENNRLRQRIEVLERMAPADRLASVILDTNDMLTESLTAQSVGIYAGKTPHIAHSVSYVDYPFGTIGIQFLQQLEHTTLGQTRYVFDASGVCVGVLDSFSGTSGLVRLFSRAGEEHQMRIGEHELALVRGRGGVTMEAVVPKSASVNVGDPVALPEAGHALVGSVGEITSSDTDTTQLVLVRLAVAPQDIRMVYIFE